MEAVGAASAAITFVEATVAAYKIIKKIKRLPKAFNEIEASLPIAERTLQHAKDFFGNPSNNDVVTEALPILNNCRKNTEKLQQIYEHLSNTIKEEGSDSTWDKILGKYTAYVQKYGKGQRAEKLMDAVLADLEKLCKLRLFRTVTGDQVAELTDAMKKLSVVEPSLPDPGMGNMTQNISNGGVGHQNYSGGDNASFNYGSGSINSFHNTTFPGTVNFGGSS